MACTVKGPAAASYLDALLLSSSVALELPVRIEEHDASNGEAESGSEGLEKTAPPGRGRERGRRL